MLPADSARNRLIGIGLVSLTYLTYTLLDGSAKWLVRSLPVIEVAWVRFVGHVLLAAALLLPRRGLAIVRTHHPGLQALRALLLLSMTAINFTVLQYLQLATTSAIFFTVPIIVSVLAGPMLGERLDAHRWTAIVVGFCGVLVIVRPFGADFHPAMLLAVGNAVLAALFAIYTRRVSARDPPEATQFLSALGAAIALAPFGLAAWQWPVSTLQWLLLVLLGVSGGVGHYLFALAHRYAPATVIGPFIYQQVIYMALFGFLVFGDVPDQWVIGGAAIVVGSGLYLVLRARAGH